MSSSVSVIALALLGVFTFLPASALAQVQNVLINDISTSEPSTGTKTVSFTVSFGGVASTAAATVFYSTRNGSAVARTSSTPGDYVSTSGLLTIPKGVLTRTINVTVLSDSVTEPTETFFVDLSARSNARIVDGTGQCAIISPPPTFTFTGGFDLSPDNAVPKLGETVLYSIVWTVPDGKVWRDLDTIDFRIRDHNKTALWVLWEEQTNLFSLCRKQKTGNKHDEDDGNAKLATGVVCTPGDAPGSDMLLSTALAELDLAESSVVGSGAEGQTVTLNLAVRFLGKAEGRSFDLELAAADDFFNQDEFIRAGKVKVQRIRPRGPKK